MATYTDSYGFDKGSVASNPPRSGLDRSGILEVTLDFAKIAAARVAAGVAALGAADVLQIIPIKAGTRVKRVGYEVMTPEGATFTFDLGDGAGVTGYFSNADGNAAAGTMALTSLALTEAAPNTITGYSAGKFYTASDTIDMVIDHANVDTAKIRVFAEVTCFGST